MGLNVNNSKYEQNVNKNDVLKRTALLFFQSTKNVRFTELSYHNFAIIPVLMRGYPLKALLIGIRLLHIGNYGP
jgi:hypothetical protein